MSERFNCNEFLSVKDARYQVIGWVEYEKVAGESQQAFRPADFVQLYEQGVGNHLLIYTLWNLSESADPQVSAFLVHDIATQTYELTTLYTAGRPSRKRFPVIDAGCCKEVGRNGVVRTYLDYHDVDLTCHKEYERYCDEGSGGCYFYAWNVRSYGTGRNKEVDRTSICLEGRRVSSMQRVEANAEELRVLAAWEEKARQEPERRAEEAKRSSKTFIILLACIIGLPIILATASFVAPGLMGQSSANVNEATSSLELSLQGTADRIQAIGAQGVEVSTFKARTGSVSDMARSLTTDAEEDVAGIAASEELGAVALFTEQECVLIYPAGTDTLIQLATRHYVYTTDKAPYKASAEIYAWWRAAYYELCYTRDSDRGWDGSTFEDFEPMFAVEAVDVDEVKTVL